MKKLTAIIMAAVILAMAAGCAKGPSDPYYSNDYLDARISHTMMEFEGDQVVNSTVNVENGDKTASMILEKGKLRVSDVDHQQPFNMTLEEYNVMIEKMLIATDGSFGKEFSFSVPVNQSKEYAAISMDVAQYIYAVDAEFFCSVADYAGLVDDYVGMAFIGATGDYNHVTGILIFR